VFQIFFETIMSTLAGSLLLLSETTALIK